MRQALAVGRKVSSAGSRFVHSSNKDLSFGATRFAEAMILPWLGNKDLWQTGTEQWLPGLKLYRQAGGGKGANRGQSDVRGKRLGSNLGEPCLLVQL